MQALLKETGLSSGWLEPGLKAALPLLGEATRLEPTNWKIWIVRARVQARLGNDAAALAAFRKARSLNPKSEVFLR